MIDGMWIGKMKTNGVFFETRPRLQKKKNVGGDLEVTVTGTWNKGATVSLWGATTTTTTTAIAIVKTVYAEPFISRV